ncbi:MAG TPA: aminotransferase class V-fold PLP-dependent enzyme [Puia sp.]|jgi:selenocysteine lyase/cysteine desulfurase|nr:aminotransferase class V-fold PLP-dependent enzyme [Puia sp.]
MDKRSFLKGMALAGLAAPFSRSAMAEWVGRFGHQPAGTLANKEEFWAGIRGGYRLKPDYINLENGYYNIQPGEILEAFISHVRAVNYEGSYYMRTVQFDNKKAVAAKLAVLAGCSPGELIITRNTTESLDMIIAGYPWKEGDEAIMAEQDYGAMLKMFRQAERRHGIVRKVVSVPNHPGSDEEIVAVYERAITPRTRLIMVSHMVNITGQVLPVRKICDMAHAKGVEVMVDGAHAFAHIRYAIPDLHCDYYGTSLHKWLSVPLGAGFLYVKKEHTGKIWPLLAEPDDGATGIALLNHTGTLPVHTDLAISDAIDYYTTLGAERKEARLRYLQLYWTSKVRDLPKVVVNTPADPARACGIANVGIKGMKPTDLAARLLDQYKIYTVAIDSPAAQVQGCRITPNVFILPEELDVLVRALKEMSA